MDILVVAAVCNAVTPAVCAGGRKRSRRGGDQRDHQAQGSCETHQAAIHGHEWFTSMFLIVRVQEYRSIYIDTESFYYENITMSTEI